MFTVQVRAERRMANLVAILKKFVRRRTVVDISSVVVVAISA